jgi:hypothetical protein
VVFGQPEPAVSQTLDMRREITGVAKRLRGVAALDDRREIENR